MKPFPYDIENKIQQLFRTSEEREQVKKLLLRVSASSLNVGWDQLARSILILSDGRISEIESIIASDFYGDPRDVIMSAEKKLDNPGHYFIQPFVDKSIIEPPAHLDGARVLKWAWSGQQPFGHVGNEDDPEREEIYGLAICQYESNDGIYHKESIYRFSCNKDWETIQDGIYDTVESAIKFLPDQYKNVNADWQTK